MAVTIVVLHLSCIVPVHFWRECTFSPKCTFSLFTSDGFPVACHSTGKRESKKGGANLHLTCVNLKDAKYFPF